MKFNNPNEFLDYWFNQCIPLVHNDHSEYIYYVYDINVLRMIKLSKIKGEDINICNLKPTYGANVLFVSDNNNILFVNPLKIWLVLKEDFNLGPHEIKNNIKDWLSVNYNINISRPDFLYIPIQHLLNNINNINILPHKTVSTKPILYPNLYEILYS